MKNSTRTTLIYTITAGLIEAVIVAIFLIWIVNYQSIVTRDIWTFLIFTIFLVLMATLFGVLSYRFLKLEHEKWKLENAEKIRQQMAVAEQRHYEQSRGERLHRENYDKIIALFKYLYEPNDCKKPEAGLPPEEILEKLAQFLNDHLSIINSIKN